MDWVQARHECSVNHVWVVLREQMCSDIQRAQELGSLPSGMKLQVTKNEDQLTVSREDAFRCKTYALAMKTASVIRVKRPEGEAEITLIPSLNDKGECRLFHEGRELQFWQASKLILESLLF